MTSDIGLIDSRHLGPLDVSCTTVRGSMAAALTKNITAVRKGALDDLAITMTPDCDNFVTR